jgi:hypothetical protein
MTWAPPDDPNPSEILTSAAGDTRDGSYAQALAKFLWFHHNALRHDSALSAVRLSFGVGLWMQLAAVYPPARAALVRTRDETEARFRADTSSFELFHELAALNTHLGDGGRTADLFVVAARDDHAVAEGLYRIAEPFLITAGRYDACGPFLDPPTRLQFAAQVYEVMRGREETKLPGEWSPPPVARRLYTHDVATLVGLLVLNHRVEEADRVHAQALTVLDDEEFRALLSAAMTGHLPPPRFG